MNVLLTALVGVATGVVLVHALHAIVTMVVIGWYLPEKIMARIELDVISGNSWISTRTIGLVTDGGYIIRVLPPTRLVCAKWAYHGRHGRSGLVPNWSSLHKLIEHRMANPTENDRYVSEILKPSNQS